MFDNLFRRRCIDPDDFKPFSFESPKSKDTLYGGEAVNCRREMISIRMKHAKLISKYLEDAYKFHDEEAQRRAKETMKEMEGIDKEFEDLDNKYFG